MAENERKEFTANALKEKKLPQGVRLESYKMHSAVFLVSLDLNKLDLSSSLALAFSFHLITQTWVQKSLDSGHVSSSWATVEQDHASGWG